MPTSSTGIAYDRRPGWTSSSPTLLFLHAGVADRRMWEPQWTDLPAGLDLVRLDLRGFGESTAPPPGGLLSHATDVVALMRELGLGRVHLVGSSFGAGVAVEATLTAPEHVVSLLLCPPGGSLIASFTDALRAFDDQEVAAMQRGDIDAAVETNVDAWLIGAGRTVADLDPAVVEEVRRMQRAAFEASERLGEVEETELDPPALERLADITVATLVLTGAHDMDAIHDAADHLRRGVPAVTVVEWPDAAHLPSLERPQDFSGLVREWIDRSSLRA